jgi:hypothetical protein
MSVSFLRQEVSSDKNKLEELHQKYPWIPGATNIRPLAEQIATKTDELNEIRANWETVEDFVLFRVFGYEFDVNTNGKFVCKSHVMSPSLKKLYKNQYPYNNLQCNHYILWYGTLTKPYESERISADVDAELRKIVMDKHRNSYQFVWYENPKMTVTGLYHVQVFWIPE